MNVLFTIQHQLDKLSNAERKLAEWILENSTSVIQMTVKSLSEAADTSPATIVRFCYSLGLEGFTDLKLKLSANLPEINQYLFSDIVPDEGVDTIKRKIKVKVIDAIEKNCETICDKAIEEVVAVIDTSEVIYTYGLGASGTVADDFAQKFLRLGKNVFLSQDPHLVATNLVTTNQRACLFLISNSGEKKEVCQLAKLANSYGIKVVAMTSKAKSSLAKYCDVLLHIEDGGEAPLRSSATNSLLVQLYTVDILFSCYASKHYQMTIEKLEKSKQAIELFEQE